MIPENFMLAKAANRSKLELREQLKNIVPNKDSNLGKAVAGNVLAFIQGTGNLYFPLRLGAFFPVGHEPNFLDEMLGDDRFEWSFPSKWVEGVVPCYYALSHEVLKRNVPLFYVDEKLQKMAKKRSVNELAMIFVPGLGFTKSGARIGRGQGHYDRVLSQYSGIKVGICQDAYLVKEEDMIREVHDQYMDFIITESRIINCLNY
jgi:5,10-methenyltetrahydrofolate synthetase